MHLTFVKREIVSSRVGGYCIVTCSLEYWYVHTRPKESFTHAYVLTTVVQANI